MPSEHSPQASAPTASSFFEGTEKKMELVVDPSLPSFRTRGRAVWDRVCESAGAKILSTLESECCTAFLLSESSLFVFDHKLVMITCGRTRLTDAVLELLRGIPPEAVLFFVYERKNEVFPHEQPSSFRDDVRLLHSRLPGRAFLFGQQHAQHVMLYHLDRPYRSETPDLTVELLMYDLDAAARPLFVADAAGDPMRLAARSALGRTMPGFQVDTHQFAPSGYSVNAIRAEEYWTVHVTPERTSSYASFETNHRFESDLEPVISQLLDLFRPASFDLVLFEQGSDRPFAADGYRLRSDVAESLSCGYDVRFRSYFRPPDGVGRPHELAVDRDGTAVSRKRDGQEGAMSETPGKPVGLWIEEAQQDILTVRYRVRKTLFSEQSEFQKIDVVETAGFGRMLFIDGLAMVSERDEFIYHEMISHVPLFVHPSARQVLVIGGGDGGTVREVLRHPGVERCRLVEIDPVVIEACRRFLPSMSSALDDPRVEVTVADGVRFVAETDERYDLVLVDSTDPIGPATPLFGPEFYGNVARVLNEGGVVVSQAESPHYESEMQRTLVGILAGIFPTTRLYNYVNLTYPGGLWSFSYATGGERCPVADLDPQAVAESGLEFRYYGADVHRAAFALPRFQQANLDDLLSPSRRSPAGG